MILLRAYQSECLAKLRAALDKGEHPLACLATGLGKTSIFCRLAAGEIQSSTPSGARRVLVLAHMDELVTQAIRRFDTQERLIAAREQGHIEAPIALEPPLVVSTRQTMARRLDKYPRDYFSLIIVDEAHHGASEEYARIFSHFENAARVGFTATPERADGKALKPWFTSCPFKMGTDKGIAEGWLITPIVREVKLAGWRVEDQKQVGKGKTQDFDAETLETSFLAADLAAPVAQAIIDAACQAESEKKTFPDKGRRQTIAFLPGVLASQKLAEELNARGHRAAHVDGTTPYAERARIFDDYRSGRLDALCNCAVLTEGFDAPACSLVAMVRPTFSRSLYTQCVGRGLRLAEGKKDCLVLDFTLEGSASLAVNVERALGGFEKTSEETKKERLEASDERLEPEAKYPWASKDQAESYAFKFQTTERIFWRGSFLSVHTLVAFVEGNPPPETNSGEVNEEEYDRSMVRFCDLTGFDPFPWSKYPPSEKQWQVIRRMLPFASDPDYASKFTSKSLDTIFDCDASRKKAGLCSLPQAWALWRFGFPPNVPKEMAKDLLATVFEGKQDNGSSFRDRIPYEQIQINIARAREVTAELYRFASAELERIAALPKKPTFQLPETPVKKEVDPWTLVSDAI